MDQRPIIVDGQTVEAAIRTASIIYGCSVDEIAYLELTPYSPQSVHLACACLSENLGINGILPDLAQKIRFQPLESNKISRHPFAPLPELLKSWIQQYENQTTNIERDYPIPSAPARHIDHDVSYATGDIAHYGDLIVRGSVMHGMQISALGSVLITGNVEAGTTINSGEDITIRGGLLGTANSQRGNITCKFAQGAKMQAINIHVHEDSVQSHMIAIAGVEITGHIVGGMTYGLDSVHVGICGSVRQTSTRIYCGHNRRARYLADRARLMQSNVATRQRENNLLIQNELNALHNNQTTNRRSIEANLQSLIYYTCELRRLENIYAASRARLINHIEQSPTSLIKIHDRIYPGCLIEIDDTGYEVKVETQYATFWKSPETGKIEMTPYD